MAVEAWRSELSVAVDKAGTAAAVVVVAEEVDCWDCDSIAETVVAAAVAAGAAVASSWKQCAGGGGTWRSERPPDLERAAC